MKFGHQLVGDGFRARRVGCYEPLRGASSPYRSGVSAVFSTVASSLKRDLRAREAEISPTFTELNRSFDLDQSAATDLEVDYVKRWALNRPKLCLGYDFANFA